MELITPVDKPYTKQKQPKDKVHQLQKRAAIHPYIRSNDIYVTTAKGRSRIHAQFRRALQLLKDSKHDEVTLHGLGKAIPQTVELALRIQEALPGMVKMEITTSSVVIQDDRILEGESEEEEEEEVNSLNNEQDLAGNTVMRTNSAIHVCIRRTTKVLLMVPKR